MPFATPHAISTKLRRQSKIYLNNREHCISSHQTLTSPTQAGVSGCASSSFFPVYEASNARTSYQSTGMANLHDSAKIIELLRGVDAQIYRKDVDFFLRCGFIYFSKKYISEYATLLVSNCRIQLN